jgi:hypothetical protein
VDEQPLEHSLDVVGLAERPLDSRTTPARERDDEIPRAHVSEPLAVEDERHARNEVRLADDELAALRNLDDDAIGR